MLNSCVVLKDIFFLPRTYIHLERKKCMFTFSQACRSFRNVLLVHTLLTPRSYLLLQDKWSEWFVLVISHLIRDYELRQAIKPVAHKANNKLITSCRYVLWGESLLFVSATVRFLLTAHAKVDGVSYSDILFVKLNLWLNSLLISK